MAYCLYLRKSRADIDAEQIEKIDTLKRHENILLELARKQNLNIVEIYREVVSADSISARPEMLKLLQAVEKKEYDGVLTADIDRLARGGDPRPRHNRTSIQIQQYEDYNAGKNI